MSEPHDFHLGSIEDAHLENIKRMSDPNPEVRMTARYNRDIINLMDKWFKKDGARVPSMTLALVHAFTSAFGTVLLQVDENPQKRREAFDLMRGHFLEVFDSMGDQVCKKGRQ